MMSYEVILAGLDLTPLSKSTFSAALGVARDSGAKEIHLLHVIPNVGTWATTPDYGLSDAMLRAIQEAGRDAERRLEDYRAPGDLDVRIVRKVVYGPPARELTAYAEEAKADIIVVASRELTGVRRAVFGSVAHALVRGAGAPVLIVSERRPWKSPRRILAAVDLSPVSERVLDRALGLSRRGQTKIHVLSRFELPWTITEDDDVLPHHLSPEERDALAAAHRKSVESLVARIDRGDAEVEIKVATSDATALRGEPEDRGEPGANSPADAILASLTRDPAELVVVGASGHNAWQRLFLGSTAKRVILEASCPVLVVPA